MRLLRDGQRGSTLVQTLLILPIFLLIVIGGYEIWKARSVKESLRSGTYQAARYLSLNPDTADWIGTIRDDFVVPELANNGLVGEDVAREVTIIAPRPELVCEEEFFIRAELPWQTFIPFLDQQDWVIAARHEGQVACR